MATPWELFAPHRTRVTQALLAAAPARSGTLVLLGAGRCRDVDLAAVTRRVSVCLADHNREAIAIAHGRQEPEVRARLRLVGGVDLGGFAQRGWAEVAPGPAELRRYLEETPGALARALPPGEVVASTCLLSQLAFQAARSIGRERPQAEPVADAVVTAHLRTLVALTVPGGAAVLVDDIAVAPRGELEARVLADGPTVVAQQVDAARANLRQRMPAALQALVREDAALRAHIATTVWLEPWLWRRTEEQTYLVHAMVLRRR